METVWVDESSAAVPGELDGLAAEWGRAPRRWGHPLHRLCSYFAMFPPQVPRVFIEWLTQPGDTVYDPFCGRGTAPVEACRLGRLGLGSDRNPLAVVLTGAKVDPPELDTATQRLRELREGQPTRRRINAPDDITMLYTPRVLRQLLWLKERLDPSKRPSARVQPSVLGREKSEHERTDRFLLATVLGLMHANWTPGTPARGLSISMPNTFSLAPGYVRRYIDTHGLEPPDVDVFEMVQRKIERMALPGKNASRGRAWMADARERASEGVHPDLLAREKVSTARVSAKLVFTSPPYLGVIRYGKYNWIRLWMLGQTPGEVDAQLVATGSLTRYIRFLSDVLGTLHGQLHPEGFLCLVLGDVCRRDLGRTINLAETVWRNAAEPLGWRKLAIVADPLPEQHKVSRIWGASRRGQATKTDRVLILAPPGSRHGAPPAPSGVSWERPSWCGGEHVEHP